MWKLLHPFRCVRRVTDLLYQDFLANGVRGVIFDLDNTLVEWSETDAPPDVLTWVAGLRESGIAACIVSNSGRRHHVESAAERMDIPWTMRAKKPLAAGLRRGMSMMGTSPETTAIIGDQLFTDILGGNSLGLRTFLVDPMSKREAVTSRLQRPLERLAGRGRRFG